MVTPGVGWGSLTHFCGLEEAVCFLCLSFLIMNAGSLATKLEAR